LYAVVVVVVVVDCGCSRRSIKGYLPVSGAKAGA
jgi:hypothetical protein